MWWYIMSILTSLEPKCTEESVGRMAVASSVNINIVWKRNGKILEVRQATNVSWYASHLKPSQIYH